MRENEEEWEYYLRMWIKVAEEAEGYEATVYDYSNDLCDRDVLERFLQPDPELRALIQSQVDAADERFRQATVDDVDGELSRYFRIEDRTGWWWKRLPANGPLADDLREEAAARPPAPPPSARWFRRRGSDESI